MSRLAFVAPRFSSEAVVGGAETLIKALAMHSAACGHEVHILTTCAKDHFSWANEIEPGTQDVDGLMVHYFRVNEDRDIEAFLSVQERIDKRRTVTPDEERVWLNNSVCSRELIAHLEAEGAHYDAILAGPYLFGITWQVSQVHPEKTWLIPCLHDESFAYLSEIKRMFLQVKGCVFNTQPERELAARLYGFPEENGAVVGLGMELFEADPDAFTKRHGITGPYIVYCGRREEGKNTPLLLDYIDAYRKRRRADLTLVLTGSGEIHPPQTLKDAIVDLGFVSEQEKQEAMAGAIAFFHPSTNESLGIVLLEAWIARTPVIVHNESLVLRDQTRQANGGIWFRFYPEFEAQLDLLLERQDLQKNLGLNGRTFVEDHYTWDAVGARLFAALGL